MNRYHFKQNSIQEEKKLGYYTVILMCVVGLLAFNEINSLKKVIRNQEERISQLEKLMMNED